MKITGETEYNELDFYNIPKTQVNYEMIESQNENTIMENIIELLDSLDDNTNYDSKMFQSSDFSNDIFLPWKMSVDYLSYKGEEFLEKKIGNVDENEMKYLKNKLKTYVILNELERMKFSKKERLINFINIEKLKKYNALSKDRFLNNKLTDKWVNENYIIEDIWSMDESEIIAKKYIKFGIFLISFMEKKNPTIYRF